jgi:hypothetical protein
VSKERGQRRGLPSGAPGGYGRSQQKRAKRRRGGVRIGGGGPKMPFKPITRFERLATLKVLNGRFELDCALLSQLPSLREVCLWGTKKLRNVDTLVALPELESLHAVDCGRPFNKAQLQARAAAPLRRLRVGSLSALPVRLGSHERSAGGLLAVASGTRSPVSASVLSAPSRPGRALPTLTEMFEPAVLSFVSPPAVMLPMTKIPVTASLWPCTMPWSCRAGGAPRLVPLCPRHDRPRQPNHRRGHWDVATSRARHSASANRGATPPMSSIGPSANAVFDQSTRARSPTGAHQSPSLRHRTSDPDGRGRPDARDSQTKYLPSASRTPGPS